MTDLLSALNQPTSGKKISVWLPAHTVCQLADLMSLARMHKGPVSRGKVIKACIDTVHKQMFPNGRWIGPKVD